MYGGKQDFGRVWNRTPLEASHNTSRLDVKECYPPSLPLVYETRHAFAMARETAPSQSQRTEANSGEVRLHAARA